MVAAQDWWYVLCCNSVDLTLERSSSFHVLLEGLRNLHLLYPVCEKVASTETDPASLHRKLWPDWSNLAGVKATFFQYDALP